MSETYKIVLTSALTIMGGVIVFVAGQLAVKFFIEPLHELRKLVGRIQFALAFHAPALMTPVGDMTSEDAAAVELRRLASDLRAAADAVPFLDAWSRGTARHFPHRSACIEAAKQLMGLSNSTHHPTRYDKNGDRITRVGVLLGFGQFDPADAPAASSGRTP